MKIRKTQFELIQEWIIQECQKNKGILKTSIMRIAEDLEITRAKVSLTLQELIQKKFISQKILSSKGFGKPRVIEIQYLGESN